MQTKMANSLPKLQRIAPGGVLILSTVSGEERAYLFKEVRFILVIYSREYKVYINKEIAVCPDYSRQTAIFILTSKAYLFDSNSTK